MIVTVNNQHKDVKEQSTVLSLLDSMNIKHSGTAVALNGKLVKQHLWEITELHDGDLVMVIGATYGG